MREGIILEVSSTDRSRLEAVVADRNSPQKHVWRSRIVLLTADGIGTVEIMRQTSKTKTAVTAAPDRIIAAVRRGAPSVRFDPLAERQHRSLISAPTRPIEINDRCIAHPKI